jgi:hypothetical protein
MNHDRNLMGRQCQTSIFSHHNSLKITTENQAGETQPSHKKNMEHLWIYAGWWFQPTSTPLKNMSSSVGIIIPHIWKVIEFMFQTTSLLWIWVNMNLDPHNHRPNFPKGIANPGGELTSKTNPTIRHSRKPSVKTIYISTYIHHFHQKRDIDIDFP